MKLKLSKQDVDGIDQNLVFNQNVTLKKTITNLQPQDLSFKLPKSKFQNCIKIHGCTYQKIPNKNFNPTCLNDTVSLHFNKGLLKSKSVTIYCHQDIHWSMRINIRVQDDATSVFVVISMFAAMLTIGNVQLYFILYQFDCFKSNIETDANTNVYFWIVLKYIFKRSTNVYQASILRYTQTFHGLY